MRRVLYKSDLVWTIAVLWLKYKVSELFRGQDLEDTCLMKEEITDLGEFSLQGKPKQRGTYSYDFETSQAPVLPMGGSCSPLTTDHLKINAYSSYV